MKRCSEPNCKKPAGDAKGLCVMHYQRLKRHGHTGRKLAPPLERFWEAVDMSGGPDACWPWQKACGTGGYGVAWDGKSRIRAHRLAWSIKNGLIPKDKDILHSCDNPPCCNPKHLWPGTDLDNRRDCLAKGRSHFAKGEATNNNKITASQILEIRSLWKRGELSQGAIGTMFGINQRTVSVIVLGKSWKHV